MRNTTVLTDRVCIRRAWRRSRVTGALVLGAACAAPSPTAAVEVGAGDSPLSAEIHAFASQGFILTLHNDYLADKTTQGSFEFSEIGFNVTKRLTDDLGMGFQLFA